MFNEMLKDFLAAYGPSGRERQVAEVIKGYVKDHCDSVAYDALGNLICHKKGTSGKKVLLTAHMDQIGFVVVDIDKKGFLRIAPVGGINRFQCIGQSVVFENGTAGVIYYEVETTDRASATLPRMFVDIGAKDRDEAAQKVRVGDMAVYTSVCHDMGGRMACGAMDNRVSCAVIAQILIEGKSEHDIYAVFTAQEEVGCRGAGPVAYSIEPDFCLNYDVTTTGDTPKAVAMDVALGGGAAVKIMDSSVIVPRHVVDFLEQCAKTCGAKTQREVLRGGGTDTGVVQRSKAGVTAGCLSIPCRYVHSPAETVDLDDVRACIEIGKQVLLEKELP